MPWVQTYDPFGQPWLSTAAAAFPIGLLFVTLAVFRWRAQWAALAGLGAALAVSVGLFGMPASAALAAAADGALYGLFPIGWIVLAAIFLYDLTVHTGHFDVVKRSVAHLSADRRVQALLIAFSFGAFIEGACGFGTPVAISAALLAGLGFPALQAGGLSLIANTAPVAFGAIGTPILALAAVTGLPAGALSAMAGRQLPFVSVIVPAWLVVAMNGWRGLKEVWPAVLVSGCVFAAVQLFWSNVVGPELVDIMAGLASLVALAAFCTVWRPARAWEFPAGDGACRVPSPVFRQARDGLSLSKAESLARRSAQREGGPSPSRREFVHAWMPWAILSVAVTAWGFGPVKALLTGGPPAAAAYVRTGAAPAPSPWLSPAVEVPGLHRRAYRDRPVVAEPVDRARLADPAYRAARAEAAVYSLSWLSATGTSIFFAALVAAAFLRVPMRELLSIGRGTIARMAWPLATIAMMLALGFVTRYGGTDATLGLAFTRTGWLYPFFAVFLGWLGVALTGSDTSSNVMFGSLQRITAEQLGLSPVLIAAANSSGGVMGKMVAAQSIVVATAATNEQGGEGDLLRFVFWHSLALAAIMGLIVMAQAYVVTWMVP
jgi:lactate permease